MRSINRSDGSTRWTWSPEDGDLNSIKSTAGLVIAKTLSSDKKTARLQALDDESGQEIWSYEYSRHSFHSTVTVGEAWIALLPSSQLRHTLILDAFTGRVAHSFNLKRVVGNSTVNSTWIQDGKLIIPHLTGIRPSTNGAAIVDLVDLTNYSAPWTVSLPLRDGGRARLELVLRHAGRTWFVVRPRGGEHDREGAIFELHSGVGAAAQLNGIALKHNEVIPNTEDADTLELDSPHLFVRTEARGGSLYQLRSHDLNSGAHLWTWELGSNRDMYTGSWPIPAVSSNAVAVVVTEIGSGGKMRTNILFIDPHNGSKMGGMTLDSLLGWSDTITLKPLGDGILVTGGQMMEVLR